MGDTYIASVSKPACELYICGLPITDLAPIPTPHIIYPDALGYCPLKDCDFVVVDVGSLLLVRGGVRSRSVWFDSVCPF